ncbi:protein TraE [Serratia ureilytica]|uniref:protein TraE n=1 Tax=Serratia ureilytica TaxID=300181 RepID=UPI00313EC7A0
MTVGHECAASERLAWRNDAALGVRARCRAAHGAGKPSAPCIGGTVNLNCSHITNACNPFDAVARFVLETSAKGCTVYAVEQVEPVRSVCLSTTGYRFVQKGFIWLCLDTGVFVDVSDDGRMRRGDDGRQLPYYGTLTRI